MADEGPDPRQLGRYLALSQVGLEMVAPIGLGIWLDSVLNWTPWLTVAGVVLGLTMGFYHLVVLTSQKNDTDLPKDKTP